MAELDIFHDWIVGVVIATEVPPVEMSGFGDGQRRKAMYAVAEVIRNRARSMKLTPVEVVLQKNQFSAVCREDYWRRAMAGLWCASHVAACVEVWREARDVLGNPRTLWYYSPVSMVPKMSEPSWLAGKYEVIAPGEPMLNRDYFRFYAAD